MKKLLTSTALMFGALAGVAHGQLVTPGGASGTIQYSVAVCNPNSPFRCAAPDASGNLPVTLSGSPIVLTYGRATTAAPTYVNATDNPFSLDLAGNLRTSILTALPAGSNTIGAVTQASGPWTFNQTQVNSVAISTGAGATDTGTQRVGVAQDTTTIAGSAPGTAGTPSSNVLSVQGISGGTVLPANVSQFGGNAVATGTGASGNGIPRVTVSNDSSVLTPVTGVATNPSATLTLSSTTTAYTAGNLIANSATAGSVVVPSFAIANSAGAAIIPRLRLTTNDATATSWGGQTITVDLWSAAPTFTNGDRGAYSPATGTANHLGAYTCVMSSVYGDGAYSECYPNVGNFALPKLASGTSVFWTLTASTGSGVTGASKVFTLTAEVLN